MKRAASRKHATSELSHEPFDGAALERVERALAELKRGRMVILTDDESRENEGDFVMAAEAVTPEAINFMAKFGRGLICLALDEKRVRQLQLPPMVAVNTSPFTTAFTVSIEAARGVTTGISAADRAVTILAAVAKGAKPGDLVRPGHIFPLCARPGGVLVRTGQTEGSVDLARLAGFEPAGVICEVMNDDGTMARRPDLLKVARRHKLVLLSVADVIRYRLEREPLVRRVAERTLTLQGKEFRTIAYRSDVDAHTHVAFVLGEPKPATPTLVRVQTACFLGDVVRADVCGDGTPLELALRKVAEAGQGVVVYLDKEPPADGKLRCAAEVREGEDDQRRNLGVGAQILRDVGAGKLALLTDHPRPMHGLIAFGLEVVQTVPLRSAPPARRASKRVSR